MGKENNNKKRKSLKNQVMISIILLIILPILISLFFIDFFTSLRDFSYNFKTLQEQTEQNIIKSVKLVDTSYRMLGKAIDDKLEHAFKPFLNAYELAGRDPEMMDLEKIKRSIGIDNLELYIIDDECVIRYTTDPKDYLFDFKKIPDACTDMTEYRQGNSFIANTITPASMSGVPTKYAYMPTPDNSFLLEFGLEYSDYAEFIRELDFVNVSEVLKTYNPALIEIQMFTQNHRTLSDPDYEISNEQKQVLKDLWDTKDDNMVIEKKNRNNTKRYIFVNLFDDNYANDASIMIEFTYTNKILESMLMGKSAYHIAVALGSLFLGLLITSIVAKRITKPINRIADDVNIIASGNLRHNIKSDADNELKTLEESINTMVIKAKSYIKKIKESELKIKRYNEKLEDMVEEKTAELKIKNAQILKELEMAKKVQRSILPNYKTLPHTKQLQFGTKYSSMDELGGDIYDVINIDSSTIAIFIADVSGHGVSAALITAMVKVSFGSNTKKGLQTGEICRRVNDEMCELLIDTGYYLTTYYCILDLKKGVLQYTNAGHLPTILFHSEDGVIEELNTKGGIIGSFENSKYETKEIKLNKNDKLLLYTDGITEAVNNKMEPYEKDRLYKYIKENSQASPDTFVDGLIFDVNKHCENRPPDDDIALLYIHFASYISDDSLSIDDSIKIETRSIKKQNNKDE